jgi:hypothetical protein
MPERSVVLMNPPENPAGDSSVPQVPARVKVVNPIGSTGPSVSALILSFSDVQLQIRVPRSILVGSQVMVRTGELVMFGDVTSAQQNDGAYEIAVTVRQTP